MRALCGETSTAASGTSRDDAPRGGLGGGGGSGGGGTGATGPIVGYGGLCVDVRGANAADFTPVQVYTWTGWFRGHPPRAAAAAHG